MCLLYLFYLHVFIIMESTKLSLILPELIPIISNNTLEPDLEQIIQKNNTLEQIIQKNNIINIFEQIYNFFYINTYSILYLWKKKKDL